MFNLFRHKATNAEPAPDAHEATTAPDRVQAMEVTPIEPIPTPVPVIRALPDATFWSGTSINDELIRVEEKWQDGALVVRAELADVDPDRDIHLTVLNRHLLIEAERRQRGTINRDGYVIEEQSRALFTRTLPLRDGVDPSAITGTYRDGVLEVRVPMPAEVSTESAIMIPIAT